MLRGRTTIPDQRKPSSRRLSRSRRDGAGSPSGEDGSGAALFAARPPVDRVAGSDGQANVARIELTDAERRLLGDLFAIVEEHAHESALPIDRDRVEEAFVYACVHHADQRRQSGEDFIVHPVGVAKICAGMRLDTETLCAALLHDTVEDTSASLEEVQEAFGEEIAGLVDGVTKLTGLTFQSRDEAQAENYRKMMVAMATDIRVILIKLADRLHNMRTIAAMPKQKQIDKARETLDIYAPIAHRLGIHAIKWELEDLAFQTLHPRKYNDIKGLVAQQRTERERYVSQAGEYLSKELGELKEKSGFNAVSEGFKGVGEAVKETLFKVLEIGAVIGEATHLVLELVESFEDLGKKAKRLGVGVDFLAQLRDSAERAGGSTEAPPR